MTSKQICASMVVPYVAAVGLIAYFVTPWVLLIFLGVTVVIVYKINE